MVVFYGKWSWPQLFWRALASTLQWVLVDGLLVTQIMEGAAMEERGRRREKEITGETRERKEERERERKSLHEKEMREREDNGEGLCVVRR